VVGWEFNWEVEGCLIDEDGGGDVQVEGGA
jgi:hypothetical protein